MLHLEQPITCSSMSYTYNLGGSSSPPKVDRIWGIWGSFYNVPKAIFYLLKGIYLRGTILLNCKL